MSLPTYKHVERGIEYAKGVVDGSIIAGRLIRLACERHLNDLKRSESDDYPYTFDPAKGDRVCRFISLLPHTKGEWARRRNGEMSTIRLEPWQCFILMCIFGWVKKKVGLRRFRYASLYVSRKNGKSIFGAGIGLYMFAKDDEPGAEVYSGATTLRQALEVFRPARQMALKTPDLVESSGITIRIEKLEREEDGSVFAPVVGNPGDGSSPHCAIIDEFHEHDTRDLYDTMDTGMGARSQPLLLVISTAGDNVTGPCRDDWRHCEKVLEGTIEDERRFAAIYAPDDEANCYSEIEVRKANPNMGVSVLDLDDQVATAQREPNKANRIKTKRLNIWTSAMDGFYDVEAFNRSGDPNLSIDSFAGQRCFIGGDFAAKRDILAYVRMFTMPDDRLAVFGRYYLPRAAMEREGNYHYSKWEREGWLTVTEGNVNDFGRVRDDIIADSKRFEIVEFAYDPSRSGEMRTIQELQDAGINCIDMRSARDRPNSTNLLSDPMKKIDAMIRAGKIIHACDPVMAWALGNVVTKENYLGQVYPRKERDAEKIDPAVALLIGEARRSLHGLVKANPKPFIQVL